MRGASGMRFLTAGEQGLVVELGSTIEPALNARVHRLAAAIGRRLADEVLEVVPTYRSLLVVFDPLRVTRARLAERIEALATEAEPGALPTAGRHVTLPVCYGGELGPDLAFVAAHAGLSPGEVVERHRAVGYLVYQLGFTPGFPYLGGLDPSLATPRLATPRARVARGSVGIAGPQTGVYPVESPGGWRLIGRTPARLFDPRAAQPFLLAAGDVLHFAPISVEEFAELAQRVEAGAWAPTVALGAEGTA